MAWYDSQLKQRSVNRRKPIMLRLGVTDGSISTYKLSLLIVHFKWKNETRLFSHVFLPGWLY